MAKKKDNAKGKPADRSNAKRTTMKERKGGVVVDDSKTNNKENEGAE